MTKPKEFAEVVAWRHRELRRSLRRCVLQERTSRGSGSRAYYLISTPLAGFDLDEEKK